MSKSAAAQTKDAGTQAAPVAPTPSDSEALDRNEFALRLVRRFAAWTGAAGFIPIPLADLVAVGGLQLQMLRRLSQIYGVEFSENRGKAVIAALAGAAIPASSGIGAASFLKLVPGIGSAAAALVMPALSSGATYAIGRVFIEHFASGGTLLDFNPPDYHEFIKAQREMWKAESGPSVPSDKGQAA